MFGMISEVDGIMNPYRDYIGREMQRRRASGKPDHDFAGLDGDSDFNGLDDDQPAQSH